MSNMQSPILGDEGSVVYACGWLLRLFGIPKVPRGILRLGAAPLLARCMLERTDIFSVSQSCGCYSESTVSGGWVPNIGMASIST